GRGVVERVVGWDRSIGIDAEDLAEQAGHALRNRASNVVADGDIQLAVLPKVQRAAVVINGIQWLQIEQDFFALGIDRVAGDRESAQSIMRRADRGVVEIDEMVLREVRIERGAHHTTFAGLADRESERGCREQLAILDDDDLAVLLGNK